MCQNAQVTGIMDAMMRPPRFQDALLTGCQDAPGMRKLTGSGGQKSNA